MWEKYSGHAVLSLKTLYNRWPVTTCWNFREWTWPEFIVDQYELKLASNLVVGLFFLLQVSGLILDYSIEKLFLLPGYLLQKGNTFKFQECVKCFLLHQAEKKHCDLLSAIESQWWRFFQAVILISIGHNETTKAILSVFVFLVFLCSHASTFISESQETL